MNKRAEIFNVYNRIYFPEDVKHMVINFFVLMQETTFHNMFN